MIKRFHFLPYYLYARTRLYHHVDNRQYKDALKFIKKLDQYDAQRSINFHLKSALVYLGLGRQEAVLHSLYETILLLEKDKSLNKKNKYYLILYVIRFLNSAEKFKRNLQDDELKLLDKLFERANTLKTNNSFSDFDVDDVGRYYRSNYPLY